MNRSEAAAGVVVLAFGLALLAGALGFPYLLQGIPGPGFLPLLISFGIVASGLVLTVAAIRGKPAAQAVHWAPRAGWVRVWLMLAVLIVAFLLLELLGFLVVTTVFMAVMIYCLGERSWRMLATVPPLSALALYGVFALWLRVPLPKGVITFLG
jgi:putative tricarboxylic transport membrane protein